MMKKTVNLLLIASGNGTDAEAIMRVYKKIPGIDSCFLLSTKEGANCLNRAKNLGVRSYLLNHQTLGQEEFDVKLTELCRQEKIDLIFLVGCIVKVSLIKGIKIYNSHPADLEIAGGNGMYGLEPHIKVLENVKDLLDRGRKKVKDRFFTCPTVYEVDEEYDSGKPLLKIYVEIPSEIINRLGSDKIEKLAGELKQHVLSDEHDILPLAVRTAVKRVLEKARQNFLRKHYPEDGGLGEMHFG